MRSPKKEEKYFTRQIKGLAVKNDMRMVTQRKPKNKKVYHF